MPDEEQRTRIAKAGLEIELDERLLHNIPVLVMSARLARLADAQEAFAMYVERIEQINESLASKILNEEDEEFSFYWEDEIF